MKKLIIAAGILIMAKGVLAQTPAPANYDSFNVGLDQALAGLKMTRADLSLRDDYVEKDSYRMAQVDKFMNAPLEMLNKAQELLATDQTASLIFQTFREYPYPMAVKPRVYENESPESLFGEYYKGDKIDPITMERIAFFMSRAMRFRSDAIFNEINRSRYDSVLTGYAILMEENAADEFKSVEELDSIAHYEEEWTKKLVDLTRAVEPEVAALRCLEFLDVFTDSLINNMSAYTFQSSFVEFETPYGKVCIGDSTPQYYYGDIFMVIDYGGDDTYDIRKNDSRNLTFIIDYGGNDTYEMPKNRFPAYGLGMNIIVDFEGDDIYQGNSWSLGAGFFGGGILWDKKGNDHYFGDTFTMGAGCFGYGILRDDTGDDTYEAALFAQGFGFTEGIGILQDLSGNDHYFAGGKYKDILRYADHYISLSQGFGYGIRPYISGGIGYLIDKAGNDTYESDIFGQGCSYWWSVGILADDSGNDKYLSYQYAQGCGTHMTVGCLYDGSGNDLYSGKGLMQGVGHDRSAAICYDGSGDDNYVASDLSQGAGSANGIGIQADVAGNDSYIVKSNSNTQGFGDARRDYGSIGIFIDLSGKDAYAGGNGADSTWWNGSNWGIGIDK
jgi:hypothetical protein